LFTYVCISSQRATSADQKEQNSQLLEHLAIRPLVLLPLDLDWFVPAPLIFQVLLILWLGGVKFGELVAFVVRSDVEGGESLIATDEEDTLDDGVIGGAVDGGGPKEILAGCFETIEKAAW
jgi:hypothetical protein